MINLQDLDKNVNGRASRLSGVGCSEILGIMQKGLLRLNFAALAKMQIGEGLRF